MKKILWDKKTKHLQEIRTDYVHENVPVTVEILNHAGEPLDTSFDLVKFTKEITALITA